MVAVALLTELPEAAEILPDLRRCQSQLLPQLRRGDPGDALGGQFVQLPQIAGQSTNDIVGNLQSFQFDLSFSSLSLCLFYHILFPHASPAAFFSLIPPFYRQKKCAWGLARRKRI